MNTQTPEKIVLDPNGFLDVQSIFYTIQGEGPFVGMTAIFLRLAGCNLQCPLCDTDYTSNRAMYSPERLVAEVADLQDTSMASLLVITGGEPFRQNLAPFVQLMHDHRPALSIQIETNGTLSNPGFPYELATIVCSPKTGGLNPALAKNVSFFKYVTDGDHLADGLPRRALNHPCAPHLARPDPRLKPDHIFLQPLDDKDVERNTASLLAARDSCLEHGYRLGVQLHKLINVE